MVKMAHAQTQVLTQYHGTEVGVTRLNAVIPAGVFTFEGPSPTRHRPDMSVQLKIDGLSIEMIIAAVAAKRVSNL